MIRHNKAEYGGVSKIYTCAVCKKNFLVPFQTRGGGHTQWVYVRKRNRKRIYCCSYKCYISYTKIEEDKRRMCKVIASLNQKGGVGKTTVTINLGVGLAREGRRVLLIDFDPQGSLTDCMGFPEPDDMAITAATIFMNQINEEQTGIGYGILRHQEGVDVLPGNIELSGLEVTLVNVMCRELVLKKYIDRLRPLYDYILIDCMPSLGILTINALAAADSVIIPVLAEKPSVRGLQQLLRTIGKVRCNMNPTLAIEGIIPNKVDIRTKYNKEVVELLKQAYDGPIKIFESIPLSIRTAETAAEGKSVYTYDATGKGAKAYESLVKEVLKNEFSRKN